MSRWTPSEAPLVTGPGWQSLDPDQRVKLAKKTVDEARDDVRAQMFGILPHGGHSAVPSPPAGYSGAPTIGGAYVAGVRNPYVGMLPPPPGYRLNY